MEQNFKSVLVLSVVGAGLIGLLWLLKPVTKRLFGSAWQYYIWVAVLFVMVLPVRFQPPVNVMPPASASIQQETQVQQTASQNGSQTQSAETNTEQTPKTASGNRSPFRIFTILTYIWLCGAVLFFLSGVISYWRFLSLIRKNAVKIDCPLLENLKQEMGIRRKIQVRSTKMLSAPLMTGLFFPVLLLPDRELSEEERTFVLLHELTHFKRLDLCVKWFSFFVNAVHWFNPLVYIAVKQMNEACEISCDIAVTKNMKEDRKNGYMRTIMRLASAEKEEQ